MNEAILIFLISIGGKPAVTNTYSVESCEPSKIQAATVEWLAKYEPFDAGQGSQLVTISMACRPAQEV